MVAITRRPGVQRFCPISAVIRVPDDLTPEGLNEKLPASARPTRSLLSGHDMLKFP